MSLRNYFLLKLHSINGQAKELGELRKLAEAKSSIILQHLAKIYLNFDKKDNDKHAREMSAEILKIITQQTKNSNKLQKASTLLFVQWLPNNIKRAYTTDSLNLVAIAELPSRYSDEETDKLLGSDFSKRCIQLLHWLDESKNLSKLIIHHKILELFDINSK